MVQTSQVIDFSSGTQPLAQWFKSALFLIELNESRTDFTIPAKVMVDWIQRFDDWFKGECDIANLCNLHLLYHREIGVLGLEVLAIVPKLQQIGEICRRLGFGFSVTLGADEAIQHLAEFKILLESGTLSTVGLRVYEEKQLNSVLVTDIVKLVLDRGVKIGLIGSVNYFQSIHLLNLPQLNSGGVTLYPVSDISYEILPTPERSTSPCFGRFRLHVDNDGRIYPCFGLLGIESACLGSVKDEFSQLVLGGQPTSLDLATWAHKGINIDQSPPERISTMPWICERHRFSLLNGIDS